MMNHDTIHLKDFVDEGILIAYIPKYIFFSFGRHAYNFAFLLMSKCLFAIYNFSLFQ